MARNRQIKADFWSDEKIGKLSISARLMFIGIWNFADDSGVCRANPVYIKNQIFPYDNITIKTTHGLLTECSQHGLIRLIEYSNEQYLEIINFTKHQLINRPSKFRYIEDLEKAHCILTEGSLTNVNVNVNVNENENVNDIAFCKNLFKYWNDLKIIQHKNLKKYLPCIKSALEHYTEQEITEAMENYSKILKGDEYFWTHKWTIEEFLNRKSGLDKFMTTNTPFDNYRKDSNNGKKGNGTAKGYTGINDKNYSEGSF